MTVTLYNTHCNALPFLHASCLNFQMNLDITRESKFLSWKKNYTETDEKVKSNISFLFL